MALVASTIRNVETFTKFTDFAREHTPLPRSSASASHLHRSGSQGLVVDLERPRGSKVFYGCTEGGKGAVETEVQLARIRFQHGS